MALEKIFGQIVDIARQITSGRASAPPPPMPVEPAYQAVHAGDPDDDTLVPSDDEVLVTRAGDKALLVSWQLTERGVSRARKLTAADAQIEARLFIITKDRETGSRTIVRERSVARAGEWLAADLPDGALITAAVGVTTGQRFVSVAHSGATALA